MSHSSSNMTQVEPIFEPKIIFFDIDDTLSRDGVIAPQNQKTLESLAGTDIKLVIATGRSKTIIPDDIYELLKNDILDAIVCTNGQYSFDKKGVISHYPIDIEQCSKIQQLCVEKNLIHKFDSENHLAWANDNEAIRAFSAKTPSSIIDADYYKSHRVYQCSVFFNSDTDRLEDVNFKKHGLKLVHWHNTGGDILPIEASKARGIIDMCHYLGIDIKDSMAIGDGFNDLEMFDTVGFAVAMGDAQPDLKLKADYITGSIEEHGLQKVLEPLLKF